MDSTISHFDSPATPSTWNWCTLPIWAAIRPTEDEQSLAGFELDLVGDVVRGGPGDGDGHSVGEGVGGGVAAPSGVDDEQHGGEHCGAER